MFLVLNDLPITIEDCSKKRADMQKIITNEPIAELSAVLSKPLIGSFSARLCLYNHASEIQCNVHYASNLD